MCKYLPFEKFCLLFVCFLFITQYVSAENDWWKHMELYEIFIQSFKDSNGDGIGDLKGITSKLDHFEDIDVRAIWITPFFESPMEDAGYDITNFTRIDPLFGTMKDFDEMLKELKKRDMKLITDLVINHSSDKHPWFQKSIDREKPYDDYYIWKDPKGFDDHGVPIPPNNWICMFNSPAWTWNNKRRQFYFHQFLYRQPDFNLRNPLVVQEIKNIIRFWIDKGVDGFRLDAAKHFIEDKLFRDNPLNNPKENKTNLMWNDYNQIYTVDQWETYEFIHDIRQYVDEYVMKIRGDERIFVVEAYTEMNYTMLYYGLKNYRTSHFPFNFALANQDTFFDAQNLDNILQQWITSVPNEAPLNWNMENHDKYRSGSKFAEEYADITTTLVMMLPGIACLYYGQEIAMLWALPLNGPIRDDQRIEPVFDGPLKILREPSRTPMQWDESLNAGFTTKLKPWLPVNPNSWRINVNTQKKESNSHYNMFRRLSRLRKLKTGRYGDIQSFVISKWVYAFTRSLKRHETYVVVINLGTEVEIIDLFNAIDHIPSFLKIEAASINSGYPIGYVIKKYTKFFKSLLKLRPMSVLVLVGMHGK